MSLTLSILSQMVDAFIHCYETEMKQWSGREKPHLSGKKYNVTLLAFRYEPLASLYASGLLTSLQHLCAIQHCRKYAFNPNLVT